LITSSSLVAAAFAILAFAPDTAAGQNVASPEQQIVALEKQWAAAVQKPDVAAASQFMSDNYFLAIAVQGRPLTIIPRQAWLDNLKVYEIKSLDIDDIQVHVYSNVAVVVLLWSQQATFRGQDATGQYLITDIWAKDSTGWRVAERHSSRPYPAAPSKP